MKNRKRLTAMIAGLAIVGLMVAAVPAMAAGYGRGMGFGSGSSIMTTVTKLLGMTQAELATQRQAGESLADIAAAKGVDQTQIVDAVVADRQAALDAAVKSGRITQAQADQALETMKTNIAANIERTTVGRPDNAGQGCLGIGPTGNGPVGAGAGYGRQGRGMARGLGQGQGQGFNGACPFVQDSDN